MRGGWHHTPETREKLSAKKRAAMSDAATRAKISADTKARMADPAVRQRIRDGMLAASGDLAALQALRTAWQAARPVARQRFFEEIFSATIFASPRTGGDDLG